MPFVSSKQRRYLYKNKPEIAREFSKEDALSRPAMKKKKKKHG